MMILPCQILCQATTIVGAAATTYLAALLFLHLQLPHHLPDAPLGLCSVSGPSSIEVLQLTSAAVAPVREAHRSCNTQRCMK
jgi:hypothetical protein